MAEVQRVVQPLFAKPNMSEKLLSKPPFRFVHDVLSAVTKATGFGEGLFADRGDLLDAKGIKEKQDKLDYLDRMILFTGHTLRRPLDIKAGKVVAGLEPEKTNRFFVEFVQAAQSSSPDQRREAAERAIAKEDPGAPAAAEAKSEEKEPGLLPAAGDKETAEPGPQSAAQSKPPPSRGGGQRNAASKEEVAPRAGGLEVISESAKQIEHQYSLSRMFPQNARGALAGDGARLGAFLRGLHRAVHRRNRRHHHFDGIAYSEAEDDGEAAVEAPLSVSSRHFRCRC